MLLWLIAIPVALVIVLLVLVALWQLLKTAIGFNGRHSASRFYGGLFTVLVWIAAAVGCLFVWAGIFSPMFEYFGSRESKGGAFGPALGIGFALLSLMAVPVFATKVAMFIRGRGRRAQA